MPQYFDPTVVCPFYLYDRTVTSVNGFRTVCEPLDGTDGVHLAFASRKAQNLFKDRYCNKMKNYRACPVAAALELKYED